MGGRVCEKNPPFLVVHYQFIPLKNHGISININDAGFRFFSATLDMSLKKGLQRILHLALPKTFLGTVSHSHQLHLLGTCIFLQLTSGDSKLIFFFATGCNGVVKKVKTAALFQRFELEPSSPNMSLPFCQNFSETI